MLKENLSPYAKIYWEEDVQAVRVEWLRLFMKLDDFKKVVEYALGILRENHGAIWIADSSNSKGVFSEEVQEYMQMDDVATFAKMAGLSMLLTVMPQNSGLSSMSTNKWKKRAEEKHIYYMEEFKDLKSCKEWIHKIVSGHESVSNSLTKR